MINSAVLSCVLLDAYESVMQDGVNTFSVTVMGVRDLVKEIQAGDEITTA
jgi:hypothetical protein